MKGILVTHTRTHMYMYVYVCIYTCTYIRTKATSSNDVLLRSNRIVTAIPPPPPPSVGKNLRELSEQNATFDLGRNKVIWGSGRVRRRPRARLRLKTYVRESTTLAIIIPWRAETNDFFENVKLKK